MLSIKKRFSKPLYYPIEQSKSAKSGLIRNDSILTKNSSSSIQFKSLSGKKRKEGVPHETNEQLTLRKRAMVIEDRLVTSLSSPSYAIISETSTIVSTAIMSESDTIIEAAQTASSARVIDSQSSFSDGIVDLVTPSPTHKAATTIIPADGSANALSTRLQFFDPQKGQKCNLICLFHDEVIQNRLCSVKRTLSEKLLSLINQAARDPELLIIDKFNIDLRGRDFYRFQEGVWLNDQIINFYFEMLNARDKRLFDKGERTRRSYYMNSFFAAKLFGSGFAHTDGGVERWTKNIDVLSAEKIFIPINITLLHWYLIVVFVQSKLIIAYDSYKTGTYQAETYCELTKLWLKELSIQQNRKMVLKEWTLLYEKNVVRAPVQKNDNDCGVFLLTFADYISDNLPLTFTQSHITTNRLRFAAMITQGEISY